MGWREQAEKRVRVSKNGAKEQPYGGKCMPGKDQVTSNGPEERPRGGAVKSKKEGVSSENGTTEDPGAGQKRARKRVLQVTSVK